MANLEYYSYLPRVRTISSEDYEEFDGISFDPYELIQLKEMNTAQLRGLMVFCNIRTYNDMPVIACEDDEMRLAYLSWRAYKSTSKRIVVSRNLNRWKRRIFSWYDEVLDSFDL